jgi:RimJ/RimL family protein N-acetyltransferase
MIFAQSERLILRRPEPRDYESYLRSWSNPEMSRYTGLRDNVGEFIHGLIAEMHAKQPGEEGVNGPWYQYSIERRSDGVLVGDIGIGFGVPGERQVEIGYRIHPDHHRQGYGREALTAIIPYLIAQHGIHRFIGVAASLNTASVKLLRSLGFRQEGHFKQSFLCHGEWLDDDYFALLASEWPNG